MVEKTDLTTAMLERVHKERYRQEQLKAAGRFKYSCADTAMPDADRLGALMEEVGEVARAQLEARGSVNDAHNGSLQTELIQVAAVAVAWCEALEKSRLSSNESTPPAPSQDGTSSGVGSPGPDGTHGGRQPVAGGVETGEVLSAEKVRACTWTTSSMVASHEALRAQLAAVTAELGTYRQLKRNECKVHTGARVACGQCHDSREQHLANALSRVKALEEALTYMTDSHSVSALTNPTCFVGNGQLARARALLANRGGETLKCSCSANQTETCQVHGYPPKDKCKFCGTVGQHYCPNDVERQS